jgi:deoxycytidylate deaminase
LANSERIIATGANDCPQFGGGQYWPGKGGMEQAGGRDWIRGFDANQREQQRMIDQILIQAESKGIPSEKLREVLSCSPISDLTEFGRVVHAEMHALLICARSGISTHDATLYSTTFPCHNCAKHILAAGISRVVYVEPYPKSKAAELHDDSIALGFGMNTGKLLFEPFVGIGPRLYFDLFSMKLGSGYHIRRKSDDGDAVKWSPQEARLRLQMRPLSYLDAELDAMAVFDKLCARKEEGDAEQGTSGPVSES